MAQPRGFDRPFFKAARNQPEVIGHRGGANEWPGETLFGFEEALKVGVDVIEMDVRSTSDGHLVLIHNPDVDETTDGRGPVIKHTLEELQKLDAGFRWTKDGGKTFPFRGRGIRIPTLEEIFSRFPGQRMNVEIKQVAPLPSIVERLVALIRKHKMEEQILIASFSHEALVDFRRACPEVATSASGKELIKFVGINKLFPGKSNVEAADAIQVKSAYWIIPILTRRVVEAAHKFNLPVHPWTVNKESEMKRVIALGVDGIITDEPTTLLSVLGRT